MKNVHNVDNGACFSDEALPRYCAKLGISLVHSRPTGRRGGEKSNAGSRPCGGSSWSRSAPTASRPRAARWWPGLDELHARFHTWVEQGYHLRTHTETGIHR